MTKPAKPGSFRDKVERLIATIEGYEDLSRLLRHVPEGRRADYLLFNRKIIVEQKEHENSPQHNAKGRELVSFCQLLSQKYYKADFYSVDLKGRENLQTIITEDERDELGRLKDRFYDKIKDCMDGSDNQIAGTKRILGLHNSIGVSLIIFDQIPGIYQDVVWERVERCFKRPDADEQYKHIDIVIASCLMKDFTLLHGRIFTAPFYKDEDNVEHREYALKIRDALGGLGNNVRRMRIGRGFPTQQLRRDIFD